MYIGIDLGGTKIAGAITSSDGETVAARKVMPTEADKGSAQVIKNIITLIDELTGRNSSGDLAGIGIGIPGRDRGDLILSAPNIPSLQQTSPAVTLSEHYNVPVNTENDANAAALAELLFGAGRGSTDFVYITISTGIGGGIIQGGRLVTGAHHMAGEIGHMILVPNGPLCGCGQRGCWEALASGTALTRILHERLSNSERKTVLRDYVNNFKELEPKHLGRAIAADDRLAWEIVKENAFYVAQGLVNIIQLLDPEKIIISGGITQLGASYFDTIREQLGLLYHNEGVSWPDIIPSPLGQDSGVLGALALARLN